MSTSVTFEFHDLPCAACGGTSRAHHGWRGGEAHHDGRGMRTEIVRCNSCTHLYPHPMPVPVGSLSDLYVNTEDYFSGHDVEEKKRHGLVLMKIFESKLQHRGRLLDVGCGRGELLWAAREAGWAFAGVDPSSAHLAWGRLNLGIEGRLGTIEEMDFPAESFDAVIMGGVLEHLYDPLSAFREVRRVLKPGGVFYFDAPNEDGLYMRMGNLYLRALRRDWVVNLAPTFRPYHVQGFNPRSLRQLLKRAGFEVDEFQISGTISPPTGKTTLRKKIEHRGAVFINWIGKRVGNGMYMDIWARKPV